MKSDLEAVKLNPMAIRFIDNPCRDAQMTAVSQVGSAISFIRNPSEEVQLAAVENTGFAIQHINNPSARVQLAAIKNVTASIVFIKNPAPEAQVLAVSKNWFYAIRIARGDITEEAQVIALRGVLTRHNVEVREDASLEELLIESARVLPHFVRNFPNLPDEALMIVNIMG